MFVCIARTSVEWSALLDGAQRALGRSITRSLDAEHLPLAGVPSFVCATAEFAKPGESAWSQMQAGSKKHAMFSFLVNLPRDEFVTLASLDLTVTPADVGDFAIISGRLSDWVLAVAGASNVRSLRKFACLLMSWFEVENLGEAWGQWRKEDIPAERLYRLVPK
jgi:hypothetical protein